MSNDFGTVFMVKTDKRIEGIRNLLENFDMADFKGKNIALKANFNSADPFPASSHPDTVQTLVKCIKNHNPSNIILAERSGMGNTRDVLEQMKIMELGKKEDNFVIEGRTSWYFIPQSIKIYLDVSLEEGARRIFNNLQLNNDRNEGNNLNTLDDVLASNKQRYESDHLRYQKYYNIDVYDPKNYDFYLDTTNIKPEAVFEAVYAFVENNLDKRKI